MFIVRKFDNPLPPLTVKEWHANMAGEWPGRLDKGYDTDGEAIAQAAQVSLQPSQAGLYEPVGVWFDKSMRPLPTVIVYRGGIYRYSCWHNGQEVSDYGQ